MRHSKSNVSPLPTSVTGLEKHLRQMEQVRCSRRRSADPGGVLPGGVPCDDRAGVQQQTNLPMCAEL